AAASLCWEIVDAGALAVAVRGDGQDLGARTDDAHPDDLVTLGQADAGHTLCRTAHRTCVGRLERDALALLRREQDAVVLVRRRDPREDIALAKRDGDETRSPHVRVLGQRRLLDEAFARRHDEEL